MLRRHAIAATAVVVALGTVSLAPATAAGAKPFKGSQKYTDVTPDATASAPGSGAGCDSLFPSQFPHEKGFQLTIPAAGKLKVDITNVGDWALEIRDPKGTVVASSDGDMPEAIESATAKIKKAGKYTIIPCNLGGGPEVTVNYSYTP